MVDIEGIGCDIKMAYAYIELQKTGYCGEEWALTFWKGYGRNKWKYFIFSGDA